MKVYLAFAVATTAVLYALFGLYVALAPLVVHLYILFKLSSKQKDSVQSVEVGDAIPGSTKARRGVNYTNGLLTKLGEATTLYELFLHGSKVGGACLGTRVIDSDGKAGAFEWQSYDSVIRRYKNFGSGLIQLGVKKANRIGIYSENRAEWQVTAQTCNAFGFVSVSIYDTLGVEHRQFIIDQAEIVTIVTKRAHLKQVFDVAPECPNLKIIIIYETPSEEESTQAKKLNLTLESFKAVEELGEENPADIDPPKPDDLAIIMYTSGTTSRPKGVLITHQNVVSVVAGISEGILPIDETTRYLSYLPLAHILERAAESYVFYHGGRVGYFQGDMRKFPDDVQTLKPTLFAGVPKVYQRIMNKVNTELKSGSPVKRFLFNTAFAIKRASIYYGTPSGFIDPIFGKVRAALGGEIKQMLTGGAPCSAECQEFIRVCFGIPFMQGYGLTETCGGSVVTNPGMINPLGKAGGPLGSCEVKLCDAGKYKTSSNPPQGEVCISGPGVTKGYYKMPEKTAETYIKEGGKVWFHTGDVGQWNDDGTLSIVGRVKDIFKLQSGEYVSPARLETKYGLSRYVANIFVYGETLRSTLIGIIVPDVVNALKWAEANGVDVPDKEEYQAPNCPASLCKNEDFKKLIMADLNEVAKESKLVRYEKLVNIHLSPTFWVPTTGLVTSAFKNKRPILAEHFADQLAELYESS